MEKIRCPVCEKGILVEFESVTTGIIRGKCGYCKHFATYDIESKTFKEIKKEIKVK